MFWENCVLYALSTSHDCMERCGHALPSGPESIPDRLGGGDCVPQRGFLPFSCMLENHSIYSTAEERVLFFQMIEACVQSSDNYIAFLSGNNQFDIDPFV